MLSKDSTDGAVINLLQITDCHLTKEADGELLGVNTRESLDAVVQEIQKQSEQPDHIIASGDLSQDASEESYAHFKSILSSFSCSSSWFPGNHDARDTMRKVIAGGNELEKVVRMGNWQIILLDSLVEGKVHGWLENSELEVLEKALKDEPGLHTLVCLHHHPVAIDSAWLDNIGLHNRDALWDILNAHNNVKAVLWGHIHQHLEGEYEGVKLMATPSTCIQFLPKSDDFAVDNIAPGYRRLSLFPNGDIESDVVRAEEYVFELDMQSEGY